MRTIRQVESVKKELREVDLRDLNYVDDASAKLDELMDRKMYLVRDDGTKALNLDNWFPFEVPT